MASKYSHPTLEKHVKKSPKTIRLFIFSFSLSFFKFFSTWWYFYIQLLLLYILQQALGVKVRDKFFLLWCFLGPEITYNVHLLCIILWCDLVELKIDLKLSLLGVGSWKEEKGKLFFFFFNLQLKRLACLAWLCFFVIENLFRKAREYAFFVIWLVWRRVGGGSWEIQGIFVLASAAVPLGPGMATS